MSNDINNESDNDAPAEKPIRISLSEEQQLAIEEATGKKISELEITLEELVNLADIVLN